MKFTGEQFIPGQTKNRIFDEHIERYRFATSFTKGKNVLDIACGTGYGTKMISKNANYIVGVDISSRSIVYANKHYNSQNIKYINASAVDELFNDRSFDVICSFETIEHLESDMRKVYLHNLNKWLKDDGVLLLSTPNKKITSPFTKKPVNQFHVLEYTELLLRNELNNYFVVNEIYGQRLIRKIYTSLLIRKVVIAFGKLFHQPIHIYSDASSAEIVKFDAKKFEPRLFVLELSKRK